jgi:predicted N-formylglutamate amidohydrolase|tara:strand:+ start:1902 stop:2687 length:786 start_codon:yes stop_codon:yes gene_type:complete
VNQFKQLLQSNEPPAFEIFNPQGQSCAVIVCDHASNRIPISLENLGLSSHQLEAHIAWDPGAARVAEKLSSLLDAPLLLSNYSRLVIDCNRPFHALGSIPEQSAGIDIPGNQNLQIACRQQRQREIFDPYQQAVSALLENRPKQKTLLISVHSFTPHLNNELRPWLIGVCSGKDSRFANLLLPQLKQAVKGPVGNNQPYFIGSETDYTIPVQGEPRGIPSVMLEIRQDRIVTQEQVNSWAELIAKGYFIVVENVLALKNLI